MSLFARLKEAAASEWSSYIDHEFVRGMADGTLPEECFRHYLVQDYIFLIHFSRAYALAAYKSSRLSDIVDASQSMSAILDEMELHIRLCERWGLKAEDIEKTPEATATMAYTRYVLEKGVSGDLLDIYAALSPCVVGYGEIGNKLKTDPNTKKNGNPYMEWIDEYASDGYQSVAIAGIAKIDELGAEVMTETRFPRLVETFAQATRLEAQFWDMGLNLSN